MLLDGLDQVLGAAIVQEEELVAESPERGSAPIAAERSALIDTVGQALAHIVEREVGEEVDGLVAERGRLRVAGL